MKPRGNKRIKLCREKLAQAFSLILYSPIIKVLHKCRDAAKSCFFYDLRYLFTGWKQFNVDVSQETVSFECATCSVDPKNIILFDDIPKMRTVSIEDSLFPSESDETEERDESNLAELKTLMKNQEKMNLIASHDVMVTATDSHSLTGSEAQLKKDRNRWMKNSSKSSKTKRIRLSINIVDVTWKFLESYMDMGLCEQAENLLSKHEPSLRYVFVISTFFGK